jgi:hypothetical protein
MSPLAAGAAGVDGAAAAAAGAAALGASACGASLFFSGALASAPAASSISTRLPSDTLSPTLTFSSLTTPASGEGTSMVALSDSREISESSRATLSPGLTSTSMTGISLKSPMSGTLTSMTLLISLLVCYCGLPTDVAVAEHNPFE